MRRNGRQSDNIIDIRSDKANENYQAKVRQELKARNSPRMMSDDSVAYNKDKTAGDRITGILRNPGKATKPRATGENRAYKDPAPEALDKTSRANYDEVPFFQHKTTGNVYKEEK